MQCLIRSFLFLPILSGVCFAGTLTGSFSPIAQGANINLTTEGKIDWIHWGLRNETSLNRKATVTSQISDFTVLYNTNLSFVSAFQYSDNFNGYSWADGRQESFVTNTTTGVYVVGGFNPNETNGFQFTVPADTAPRTLKVYVGTYAARGRFQASLSDHPTSYTNTALINFSNGPGGVYTINFSADSTNQTLTIRWTASSKTQIDGNVTLQAAALTADEANNPPFAKIASPAMNAVFTAPANITLDADAFDPDGTVSKVEFYRNGTHIGESASEPYLLIMTNVPAGHYQLTANPMDNGGAISVSRPIDIFVHSAGGTLNGSVAFPPGSVDLTVEGNVDWVHWGLLSAADVNRKAVPTQISSLTKIGTNELMRLTDFQTASSWSDGTPTSSVNNVKTGIFVSGITNGFQFSVPAHMGLRTLKVYVGLYGGSGNFQAWLSDFSAPAFTDRSLTNAYENSYAVYTLDYAAASAGQTLNIKYTSDYLFDQDFGNVALHATTLNGGTAVLLFNPVAMSGSFNFSFQTEVGRNYNVRYTDSLNPIIWQTLTNISGSGLIETVTDSADQPHRFYGIQTN
jgi:hypothetical protein